MNQNIDEWLVNLLEWKFTTTEPAMAISPHLLTRLPFDRVVSVKVPASLFRFGLICRCVMKSLSGSLRNTPSRPNDRLLTR
jgi:hypothetical protein